MKFCKIATSDELCMLPESVTVGATVDDTGDEHVITDMMMRRACEQMDGEQLWPFGSQSALGSHSCRHTPRSATILQFPSSSAIS